MNMDAQQPNVTFNAFLPLALVAVSMLILLTWNLSISIQQRFASTRVGNQQLLQLEQASAAENKLQLMMTDLLELAKKDGDAKVIVKKYAIKMNANAPLAAVVSNAAPAEAKAPAP